MFGTLAATVYLAAKYYISSKDDLKLQPGEYREEFFDKYNQEIELFQFLTVVTTLSVYFYTMDSTTLESCNELFPTAYSTLYENGQDA